MSKDTKTTTKALLEEIDRITYWGSVVAIVGLSIAYFWISSWNPSKSSSLGPILLVALHDYLLALITNLVPVCLIFAISYAVFRHIQSIRFEQESEVLADTINKKTHPIMVGELQSMQQKIDALLNLLN